MVDGHRAFNHQWRCVLLKHAPPAVLPQVLAQVLVGQEHLQRPGKRVRIIRRDDESGVAVLVDRARAGSKLSRNQRQPGRHCFEQHDAEGLGTQMRGQYEDVGGLV